jgi:hypothetical protein
MFWFHGHFAGLTDSDRMDEHVKINCILGVHVCEHMCVLVCVHSCVYVCVHVCLHISVHVSVHACVPIFVNTKDWPSIQM